MGDGYRDIEPYQRHHPTCSYALEEFVVRVDDRNQKQQVVTRGKAPAVEAGASENRVDPADIDNEFPLLAAAAAEGRGTRDICKEKAKGNKTKPHHKECEEKKKKKRESQNSVRYVPVTALRPLQMPSQPQVDYVYALQLAAGYYTVTRMMYDNLGSQDVTARAVAQGIHLTIQTNERARGVLFTPFIQKMQIFDNAEFLTLKPFAQMVYAEELNRVELTFVTTHVFVQPPLDTTTGTYKIPATYDEWLKQQRPHAAAMC